MCGGVHNVRRTSNTADRQSRSGKEPFPDGNKIKDQYSGRVFTLTDELSMRKSWMCLLVQSRQGSLPLVYSPLSFSIFSCLVLHSMQEVVTGLAINLFSEMGPPHDSHIP